MSVTRAESKRLQPGSDCFHNLRQFPVPEISIVLTEAPGVQGAGLIAERSVAEFFSVRSTRAELILGPVSKAGFRVVTKAQTNIPQYVTRAGTGGGRCLQLIKEGN